MDIKLPDENGIQAVPTLVREHPEAKVLVQDDPRRGLRRRSARLPAQRGRRQRSSSPRSARSPTAAATSTR
jgi:DNA-binding NarL/FixJ family response regulator